MVVRGAAGGDETLEALVCGGERLRITLLPDLGAKVTSLFDLATGREWLARADLGRYRRASLDSDFSDYDKSGWDECFPSIGAGFHPTAPWEGIRLPDHGELWSRPWQCRTEGNTVVSTVYGARFPYRFERRLTLAGSAIHASYTVTNLVEFPFPCLWAMHPLFAVKPGMRVLVPDETRVTVDITAIRAPGGYLERLGWPIARTTDGRERDLSRLEPPHSSSAVKLFTERLKRGRAALHDPEAGAWLGLSFDPHMVPYLGVWLNEGGWPSGPAPLYHVALEPATGRADHLDVAMRLGEVTILPPSGSFSWQVSLVVGEDTGTLEAFLEGS